MPLAPRTLNEYRAALRRLGQRGARSAFGDPNSSTGQLPDLIPVEAWQHLTNSGRLVMRAALRWAYKEAGQDELGKRVAEQIPFVKEVRRVKQNPTRADVDLFAAAARNLPAPWRDLLLIGISMGFRREELLTLPREAIEKALRSEDKILRFVRKGSIEDEMPIVHIIPQLRALLRQPAVLGAGAQLDDEAPEWDHLWQVIGTSYRAAYEKLLRKVRSVAKSAGCSSEWTPHVMRHAFASEMARDGASLPAIQEAMNHASYQTSLRYIHVDAADLQKWMKPRGGE